MAEKLIIGAMSGTSADGVDSALCSIENKDSRFSCHYIGHVEYHFSSGLKDRILSIRNAQKTSLEQLSEITRDISLHYVQAVEELLSLTRTTAESVHAIAAHGQTLFHRPPLTMQIFDPALVAHRTGIDVVSDFRRADCAAGGQGAPLVPFADYHLFRSESFDRIILNIGGISNITVLKKNCSIDHVIGFDTGPGNCISDWLTRDQGGVDIDGKLASHGTAHLPISESLLQSEYFQKTFPKSTDGPAMIRLFEEAIESKRLSIEDLLATAADWVARSIDLGIRVAITSDNPTELIVAGGGTKNRAIMHHLDKLGYTIRHSDELGIPTQAREAIAFAILGCATLEHVPANLPHVTGAKQKVMLGSITFAK